MEHKKNSLDRIFVNMLLSNLLISLVFFAPLSLAESDLAESAQLSLEDQFIVMKAAKLGIVPNGISDLFNMLSDSKTEDQEKILVERIIDMHKHYGSIVFNWIRDHQPEPPQLGLACGSHFSG